MGRGGGDVGRSSGGKRKSGIGGPAFEDGDGGKHQSGMLNWLAKKNQAD